MPLEITQREMNGIYLLALKGRLVLGQESRGLLTMFDNLVASGATRIVINLEQVLPLTGQGCPHEGSDRRLLGHLGCPVQRKRAVVLPCTRPVWVSNAAYRVSVPCR